VAALLGAILVACGSAPPPAPAAPAAPAPLATPAAPAPTKSEQQDVAPDGPSSAPVAAEAPERSALPSTARYEDALSKPEQLDVRDDRVHLTDGQLIGPIRGVLTGCPVSSNARVTIKTAVQHGRAIGVTVTVRFERPKSAKHQSRAAAKAEAKTARKIVACVDRNVRAVVWPPSSRRDSFTTEF
jgi:hypothetical protein